MLQKALALSLLVGTAGAMDSNWNPELSREDRQKHFIAGAVISGATRIGLEAVAPSWKPWQRDLAAFAVGALAGVAKEALDSRDSAHHSSEAGDIAATSLGALGGTGVVSVTIRFAW